MSIKINLFCSLTHQAELGNRHSQTGVWERDISDSKTSAGMDRTDDIKKGIYQTLKIGITHKHEADCKTAIISNLPAYRHNEDYLLPFVSMLWGVEDDLEKMGNKDVIVRENLRYLFDYIIKFTTKSLRVLVITVIPAWMLESSHRDVFECKPSLASGLRQSLPQ